MLPRDLRKRATPTAVAAIKTIEVMMTSEMGLGRCIKVDPRRYIVVGHHMPGTGLGIGQVV